jgi:hypothetical protein
MSLVLMLFVTSTITFAGPSAKTRILPVTQEEELVKREKIAKEKLKLLDKKVEDCDEKAKKPVEIKPESISLTGNAGCSLDQAH